MIIIGTRTNSVGVLTQVTVDGHTAYRSNGAYGVVDYRKALLARPALFPLALEIAKGRRWDLLPLLADLIEDAGLRMPPQMEYHLREYNHLVGGEPHKRCAVADGIILAWVGLQGEDS